MDEKLSRRDFLGTMGSAAAASVVMTPLALSVPAAQNTRGATAALGKTTPYRKVVLEPFDYAGVTLRQSLWQRQAMAGRDFYFGLSNDDILHGYRVAAGMANAPGRALGGWCSPNSNTVFGQWLHWLPVSGMADVTLRVPMDGLRHALDVGRHLVLPALTLALVNGAAVARFHRAAMIEALGADFVRAARARGLSEGRVLVRHALRSALAPAITLAGLSIPALLTGSVLVESVFGWPGMGRVAYEAIFARDYNVITAVTVVAGVLVALGNLLADLGVAAADPRVRRT